MMHNPKYGRMRDDDVTTWGSQGGELGRDDLINLVHTSGFPVRLVLPTDSPIGASILIKRGIGGGLIELHGGALPVNGAAKFTMGSYDARRLLRRVAEGWRLLDPGATLWRKGGILTPNDTHNVVDAEQALTLTLPACGVAGVPVVFERGEGRAAIYLNGNSNLFVVGGRLASSYIIGPDMEGATVRFTVGRQWEVMST